MVSNQMAPMTDPPRYGDRSYAEIIKQRLIYGRFYAGWSMRQGRYVFQVMYATQSGSVLSWQPIGYEMTLANQRSPNGEDDWILRTYLDGTALYRPHLLGWLRYPTLQAIKAVVDYFYFTEATVRGDHGLITKVMRRKALNPHQVNAPADGFGQFLTKKYNGGEQ